MRIFFHPLLISLILLHNLLGCGQILKIFPKSWRGEGDKNSTGLAPNTSKQNTQNSDDEETLIQEVRLFRRISLDLKGTLPTKSSAYSVLRGETNISAKLGDIFSGTKKYEIIAEKIRVAWRVKIAEEGSLDHFFSFASSDSTLPSNLSLSDLKSTMAREVFLFIGHQLQKGLPPSELTSFLNIVAADDLLGLYSIAEIESSLQDPGFSMGIFDDDRPAMGLLSSPAFFSLMSHSTKNAPNTFAQETLALLNCAESMAPKEHRLYNVTTLSQIETESLSEETSCRQCHLPLKELQNISTGFSDNTSFAAWLGYSSAGTLENCSFYGQRCVSAEGWAAQLGHEKSFSRCFIKHIVSQFLHTKEDEIPSGSWFGELIANYYQDGESIPNLLRRLIQNDYYAKPSFDTLESDGDPLTGTRFLTKTAWQNIAINLTGDAADLSISDDLEPGFETTGEEGYKIPGTSYAFAVEKNASALAKKIVTQELRNGAFRGARTVFTLLADEPCGEVDNQIKAQIADMWFFLTGFTLEYNEDMVVLGELFYEMFTTVNGGSDSINSCFDAWETVLANIFLSPEFLVY